MRLGVDTKLTADLDKMQVLVVSSEHEQGINPLFVDVVIGDELKFVLGCIFVKAMESAQEAIKNAPKWDQSTFS